MIKGYKNLTEQDKALFTAFCENYKAANSSDIEFVFTAVKRQQHCLRVDMTKNNRKTYQEVFNEKSWG